MGFAEIRVIRPPSYPIFALYPRFVGVINSIRLKAHYGLKLCNVLRMLMFLNAALRNNREIASLFHLSFFVPWTHVFSLLAHRGFWYMPSTQRGSVGPTFPMRWTLFRDCVTFVDFACLIGLKTLCSSVVSMKTSAARRPEAFLTIVMHIQGCH